VRGLGCFQGIELVKNRETREMLVPFNAAGEAAAPVARMAKAARGIRLLSLVSWPASEQQTFLAEFAHGRARLPAHEYPKHDFSDARREFEAIIGAADPAHPLGIYLVESARSWSVAAELLENLGTPRVVSPDRTQAAGRPRAGGRRGPCRPRRVAGRR